MYLPDPKSLGLPPKFAAWRAQQEEAVFWLLDGTKRFLVPVLPTGAGKGLVYLGYALLAGKRTAFLTITKGLQTQNMDDFKSVGMMDLRGQNAYECIHPKLKSPVQCDDGPCHSGVYCEFKDCGCYYYDAHRMAANPRTRFVQSNYKKWILELERAENLKQFEVLVLDEGHDAFEALSSHLSMELTRNDMMELGVKELPAYSQFDDWRKAAAEWEHKAIDKIGAMEVLALTQERRGRIEPRLLQDIRGMKNLSRRLSRLKKARGEWIHQKSRQGSWAVPTVRFDPLWPGEYAEELLFAGIPKIIMTSATISKKTLNLLGVPESEVDYRDFPSTFPVKRRPIYILRGVPKVRRFEAMPSEDRDIWVSKIESIIRPRVLLGWKGVIHPVSYERGKWLYNHSRYNQHMLLHEQDTSVEDIVAKFRQSPAGTILVSPSVKTGFDFPGDACRYQILIKVPFPDTRNIILKKREEIDKNYSPHVVCQTIEQATGRSTRSPEDWSEVFLVDGQFYWYIPKHREEFMHKWFLEAVSWVNVAPEPLNFGSLQLNKPKGDEAYGLR